MALMLVPVEAGLTNCHTAILQHEHSLCLALLVGVASLGHRQMHQYQQQEYPGEDHPQLVVGVAHPYSFSEKRLRMRGSLYSSTTQS